MLVEITKNQKEATWTRTENIQICSAKAEHLYRCIRKEDLLISKDLLVHSERCYLIINGFTYRLCQLVYIDAVEGEEWFIAYAHLENEPKLMSKNDWEELYGE